MQSPWRAQSLVHGQFGFSFFSDIVVVLLIFKVHHSALDAESLKFSGLHAKHAMTQALPVKVNFNRIITANKLHIT